MDITIKTKYGKGDIVYGYHNGGFRKFKVDYIKVSLNSCYHDSKEIRYGCTAIVPEDCELTYCEEFEEQEMFTKEDIVIMLENIKND